MTRVVAGLGRCMVANTARDRKAQDELAAFVVNRLGRGTFVALLRALDEAGVTFLDAAEAFREGLAKAEAAAVTPLRTPTQEGAFAAAAARARKVGKR